jgi:hypothetical protein
MRNMFAKQPEKSCLAFKKQEPIIRDIMNQINNAEGLAAKARFVEELQLKANILLSCPDYSKKKTDCKNCHCIANLRKKTADLILKVKKLG